MAAHEANPGKSKGQPPKPTHKASWRKAGAAAGAAAARGWSKTKPVSAGPSDRSVKLAALGLVLVGLVVAYILFVFFRPRGLPIIAIAVTNYESDLIPPNAWAQEDRQRLGKLEQAKLVADPARAGAPTDLLSKLDRQLAAAPKGGGPDKNVLLVVLSAHGVVNAERKPCLLVEDSQPLDPATWLPLEKVATKLDNFPGYKHKVLVLDCHRVPANWSLGLLHNDFAEQLAALAAGLKSVVVIASAGPGQTAQAAPELGGSAFGYYLARGLEGQADGNGDGRVGVQELLRYLQSKVDQWALEHRETRQQPVMLQASPAPDDFSLVYTATHPLPLAAPPAPRAEPWQTVAKLWQRRDQLAERNYLRYDPLGWAGFQRKLLRVERLLLAGQAYEADADSLVRTLDEWAGDEQAGPRLAKRRTPDGVVAATIPLTRQWSPPPLQAELDRLRAAWPEGAALPSAEQAPPGKFSRAAVAVVGWERLGGGALAEGAAPDALRKLLDYLDQAKRPEGTLESVEWQWLRLVARRSTPLVTRRHLRLAIEARDAGEAAAAALGASGAADERGQYAVAPSLAAGDEARRAAEDRLLVGASDSLAEAEQFWSRATAGGAGGGDYARARELVERLAAAHATRDLALAEAPYWSAWAWQNMLAAQLPQGSQGGAGRTDSAPALESLQQLLSALPKLGAAIDRVNAGDEAALLNEPLEQVAAARARLAEAYEQVAGQLRGSGKDQRKLAALEAVLAVPLLDAGRRNQLRREHLEIIQDMSATPLDSANTAGGTAAADVVDGRDLLPWPLHPAVLLTSVTELPALRDEEPALDESPRPTDEAAGQRDGRHQQQTKALAGQSARLRQRLHQLRLRATKLGQEAAGLDGAATAGLPASRAVRSQADRLVRAYAALIDGPPAAEDPVEQLRRADLHEQLLTQARRAADDFLGPSDAPYFLDVALASLGGAKQLLPGAAPRRKALADLVEGRRQAAVEFVDLTPEPLPVIEGRKRADHRVKVTPAANLPPGVAAFAVELGNKPLPLLANRSATADVPRLGVTLANANADTLDYTLPLGSWAGQATSEGLEALLLYRGHERRRNIPVAASGRKIEYLPDVFGPPRVTVKGSETQTGAVMFIFDCSGSMSARDVTDKDGKEARRIDAARTTLLDVLTRMAVTPTYQVGLTIYGHRVAWVVDANSRAVVPAGPLDFSRYEKNRQTLGKGKDVFPFNDIERVLDVGRFSNAELKQVRIALAELEPWGQTPLYMAMVQAIEALGQVEPRYQRRIIAITDGFDDPGDDFRKERQVPRRVVYLADVQAALAQLPADRQIQLDIMGLNLTAEAAERSRQSAEEKRAARAKAEEDLPKLQKLADGTGGKFYNTRGAGDLVEALRKSLRPGRFLVKASGEVLPPEAQPKELNEAWEVGGHPQRRTRRPYDVVVAEIERPASVPVELEGGEALELYLEPSPERPDRPLVFRRYRSDEQASAEVPVPKGAASANSPPAVWIAAHLPEFVPHQTYRDAKFYLSVQNADATRFSPRPVEVGAEIRPVLGKNQLGDPYLFVEGNFVPDRPAPLVQFVAPRWPATAQEAQIAFWCKFAPTRPDDSGSVTDMQHRPPAKVPDMRVEADFGDEPQGDYQVRVVGDGLAQYKIDINPPAKRIVRQLNPQGQFVQQAFYFNNTEADRVGSYTLSITSLAHLRKDAVHLAQPLVRAMPAK